MRACSLAGVGARPRVRTPRPWSLSSPLIPASPAPGPTYLPSPRPLSPPAPHPRGRNGPCADAQEQRRGQESGAGTSRSALVPASAREQARGRGGEREERRPPLPIRNTAADERRATPGRPAAATAASPRRRHLSPAARAARPELGAPGSAPRAAAPPQSPRCAVSAAPCLRLAARGQLRSCGAGRGAGSGRAAGRRRRRAPASRRASRRPGRRCLLLLAGVESGRPCPGAGLADATEPLSPPAAALSCCPKWKRKPWDWRGRMGTRGRCRKTCKVSGRGALAPAATAPRAPRTWSWRRRRRAPPQGRHRSFGLSNRARWGIRQAMPDRPLPVERRFQLPGNPSRRLRPKGCGKGRSC